MFTHIKKTNQKVDHVSFSTLLVFIICVMLLQACGDNKKSKDNDDPNATDVANAYFNLHGIKYDSSLVQKWIDDTINYKKFVFQYYTDNLNQPSRRLKLVSYVQNKDRNWVDTIPENLIVISDSSYRLSGDVILGNTEKSIPFIARLLKKADGTTISYDYIFFKPIIRYNHLTYAISIIKNNTKAIEIPKILGDDDELNPVPPGRPSENK